MKHHILSALCLAVVLTFIFPSLGHPTAEIPTIADNAYNNNFGISHKLICESGHSGVECFRLFGTQCGPQNHVWSPSPHSNSESCTPKQCQCISRSLKESPETANGGVDTDPNMKVVARAESKQTRVFTYYVQVRLVCDKGVSAHICKLVFETGCSNHRRVISPAYDELGSCTSKQCHCVTRTLHLNLPDKREMIVGKMRAEDAVAESQPFQQIDEKEGEDEDWVDVEGI